MTCSRDESSSITYLAKGQPVTAIGLGETMDYVAARTVTDQARGWVDVRALESLPAGLLDALRKRRHLAIACRELIARHQVVLAMTRDEVGASLGRPDRKSRVRLPAGDHEQWVYKTYRYLPTYRCDYSGKGKPRQVVSYKRTLAGRKVVTFRDDEVIALSDKAEEGAQPPAAAVIYHNPPT
ncbi:MAG: hypothetical protein ABSH21_07090 [Verrucomicrobiia bacterium]